MTVATESYQVAVPYAAIADMGKSNETAWYAMDVFMEV
jgi:hypothetical protein